MHLQLFHIVNAYNIPAFSYRSHSFRHSRESGNPGGVSAFRGWPRLTGFPLSREWRLPRQGP